MKLPEEFLEAGKKLMIAKRADYTTGSVHENFERSESIARWFKNDTDKVYVTMIATKLARLASLLSENKTPNNESIEDSFIDLINYSALWASRRSNKQEVKNPKFAYQAGGNYYCSLHHVQLNHEYECVICGPMDHKLVGPSQVPPMEQQSVIKKDLP